MNSPKIYVLLLFFTTIFLQACKEDSSSKKEFDQSELLSHIGTELIIPSSQALRIEAKKLDSLLQDFSQDTKEAKLLAVQIQWKSTMLVWKKCQLFNFGAVEQAYLENRIQKWPVNETFIQNNLSSTDSLNSAFIEGIGATAKGLSALEYMLFSSELSNSEIVLSFQNDKRRVKYATALATNISEKCTEFAQLWSSNLDAYNAATGTGFSSSVALLVNKMVAELEKINKNKIAKAAGLSGTVVNGDMVEAKRSAYSKELIVASLENLKATFIAGDIKNSGFDDYLNAMGAEFANEPLSNKILTQIDSSIKAVENINGPLHEAVTMDAENVAKAREAILQLLVLVKVDLSSSLSITITFSDSDGD